MAPLEWSEKFHVGILEMDQEHESLFSLVNALTRGIASGMGEEEMSALFVLLLDAARRHFNSEERLMELAHYPGLAKHRTSHHHLFDEVTRLLFRARTQRQALESEVVPLLQGWLTQHILTEDLDMARFVSGARKGAHGLSEVMGHAGGPRPDLA